MGVKPHRMMLDSVLRITVCDETGALRLAKIMSGLILWIFDFISCGLFFLTGELLLYIVTFGKHNIRNTTMKFYAVSYYVGIAFWIALLVAVKKYLF
jgi:hypothetical protein